MAVTRGAAGLHGRVRAHAAILLIHLAVDFHDLARGFRAAGEEAAADDAVREGEGFDEVAGFGDAAIRNDADAFFAGGLRGDIERGELRDADARDGARGADGAGA